MAPAAPFLFSEKATMSIMEIIETLRLSSVWGKLTRSEQVEAAQYACDASRRCGVQVTGGDENIEDLCGEVFAD
jgi:hypothetical protein